MELIAAMCDNLLGPNMTHFDALLQQVNIVSGGTSTQATVVDKCASCGPQDIGACQNIGKWGSFHSLGILVSHVPRYVPKAYWQYRGRGQRRLEFRLDVFGGPGCLLSVANSPFSNMCGAGEATELPVACA